MWMVIVTMVLCIFYLEKLTYDRVWHLSGVNGWRQDEIWWMVPSL